MRVLNITRLLCLLAALCCLQSFAITSPDGDLPSSDIPLGGLRGAAIHHPQSGISRCHRDLTPLQEWRAGTAVIPEDIKTYGGVDKCFAAEPVPDGVWARMQGKTYKPNPHIGRDDLRHIRALHRDIDGTIYIGEIVCNVRIADRLVRILRQLYDARYPIQRMVLPDVYDADDERQMRDNNSSCFCYRAVSGTKVLSKHSQGLAVDINTLYNPYYKDRADGTRYVQPATAAKYCNRNADFPYKITRGDLCHRLFIQAGFQWGGEWKSCKDFQHFEWKE